MVGTALSVGTDLRANKAPTGNSNKDHRNQPKVAACVGEQWEEAEEGRGGRRDSGDERAAATETVARSLRSVQEQENQGKCARATPTLIGKCLIY